MVGLLLVMAGALYGYAAAEHYGWLLRRWLMLTVLGNAALLLAVAVGPSPARIAAVLLFVGTMALSIDPAQRLLRLGWDAP